MTGGAHTRLARLLSLSPSSNDAERELYRSLGRIEQSIADVRQMLLDNSSRHDALEKRVGSLERSRAWAKAWIAGAIFVWTALLGFAMYVYQILKAVKN